MKTFLTLPSLMLVCLSGCTAQPTPEQLQQYDRQVVPYEFTAPDQDWELPEDLVEISGLASAGPGLLAAIEDEHGRLYMLNTTEEVVMSQERFAKNADFEGIEIAGGRYFAIESNGDLHSFIPGGETTKFDTPFSEKNNIEGLGYDGRRLIVACKGRGSVGDVKTKHRAIYRLHPDKPETAAELWFEISLKKLTEFLQDNARAGVIKEFDPSAIAYLPADGLVYILSADHWLVVTNTEGDLREVVFLDPATYRQPEGICFDAKGTLFLASEGAGKKARLFRFNRN